MRPSLLHTVRFLLRAAAGVVLAACLPLAAAQDSVVPQSALSTCKGVNSVSREEVAAGTGLAVSPDGRWLALYVHTNRGGEVTLRSRDAGETHRIELIPPALPPGVAWRVLDVVFSSNGNLLAVRTTGSVWVADVATGLILYQVSVDSERQIYPGKLSLAADTLAVLFWPPESYLAEAKARKGVEARFYEAATGKFVRSVPLAVDSSDAWTNIELSPDANWFALLRRPMRWPGKAHLSVHSPISGLKRWENKLSAEDFQWSADGNTLIALGQRLVWLDAETGKQVRESKSDAGSSEYHQLRINEGAGLAVGQFSKYSRWKRSVLLNDRSESMIALWRLDGAALVCQTPLPPSQSIEAWLTSQGEIITLEETYDLRPQLRLLKSAQIVTYRLATNH
jgi:WD40 repeat protein